MFMLFYFCEVKCYLDMYTMIPNNKWFFMEWALWEAENIRSTILFY